MLKYCIIIPCFNEASRILTDEYLGFVSTNPSFNLLFIDDGSIDDTSKVLLELVAKSDRIDLVSLPENKGKAEAIREGMQNVLAEEKFDIFGYLDADLAIPFSELLRLKDCIDKGYEFAFSSKKQTEGSELEIKLKRYFVGRVLSKMVQTSLKLKIYDTQCGCKVMTKKIAAIAFQKPFFSSWLFDVEVIWRIIVNFGRAYFNEKAIEVPVQRLIDRGSSRIRITDLFSLPFEFLKIHSHYKKQLKRD